MSLINTGLSGLLAAQRALDVTASNVANANTDGYVRRRVQLAEATAPAAGAAASAGNGVNVVGVQRLYDEFIGVQLRDATSSQQRAQALSDLATRLDSLLGSPDQGISKSIQDFFAQLSTLARDPTSVVNRQQVLLQADAMGQRFQQLDSQLNSLAGEVNLRVQGAVGTINDLAASLAKLNGVLGQGGAAGANDLVDQRELLLKQLTAQVDVQVLTQPDGSVNVLAGNGQPLVLGIRSATLSVVPDNFDPTRMQVALDTGDGKSQVITRQIAGGVLGGLLAFRDEALEPARRDLGLAAQALTGAVNAQNRQGVDANGALGGDLFAPIAPVVLTGRTNAGAATVTASIADPGALAARDYTLRFDGAAWQFTDSRTGAVLAATGSGTAADPFVVDGLHVVVAGAATQGDSFQLRPVNGAAGRLALAVADPSAIAAASPVHAAASLQNVSAATVSAPQVIDIANPALLQRVSVVFDDATTYRIRSAAGTDLTGPLAYASAGNIDFNGWRLQVTGTPAAGDRFDVTPAGPGSGDNGNALALAQANGQRSFKAGTASLNDIASQLLATVGSTAQRASSDLSVQTALQQQVEQDSSNASGVNLNEEAANMLRYQQAYNAASKIIAMSNDLFQTLLNVVR